MVDTIPEKEESKQANNTKYYISEDNPVDRNKYETVTNIDQLRSWVKKIYDNGVIAID